MRNKVTLRTEKREKETVSRQYHKSHLSLFSLPVQYDFEKGYSYSNGGEARVLNSNSTFLTTFVYVNPFYMC